MNELNQKIADLLAQAVKGNYQKLEVLNPLSGYASSQHELVMQTLQQVTKDDNGRVIMRYEDEPNIRLLYLYGQISSYDYIGITAEAFAKALPPEKDKPIRIHFNSMGGSVFESTAMYATLDRRTGKISGMIDSICGSAAVNVLMACSERKANSLSNILVHKTRAAVYGTDDDLFNMGRLAKEQDDALADLYSKVTGRTKKEMITMMKEDAVRSATTALEMGFVQEIIEPTTDNKDDLSQEAQKQLQQELALRAKAAFKYTQAMASVA